MFHPDLQRFSSSVFAAVAGDRKKALNTSLLERGQSNGETAVDAVMGPEDNEYSYVSHWAHQGS